MLDGESGSGDDGDSGGVAWENAFMMDTTARAIHPLVGGVLRAHLPHMGSRSLFNLAVALDAMRRNDIDGTLTIRVTGGKHHSLEVDWSS